MPRATKNLAHVMYTSVSQENSVSEESSCSDQVMELQSPSFQPSTSQAPFVLPMFIPYIEGSKMDWTVNGGLYPKFLKWKLKCENILDCKLARLPESKKCKIVIAWSGDLKWINMFPGDCPRKILALIQYGPSMKIFASHKLMNSKPDLTFLQASGKEIDW